MKIFISILIALLVFSSPGTYAFRAITVVANSINGDGGVAPDIDSTSADVIVVHGTSFSLIPTIASSPSCTWDDRVSETTNNIDTKMWTATGCSDASLTITVTGSFPTVVVAAFDGLLSTTYVTGTAFGDTVSGTSIQPGSITPATAGGLMVSAMQTRNPNSAIAVNSGFTITDQVIRPPAAHDSIAMAWKTGTASATNPTWSWTDSTFPINASMVSFAGSSATSFPALLISGRPR